MPLANFSFGVVELKDLLSVSAEPYGGTIWQVIIHYKNEKNPICIKCENEENAKKYIKEVQDEINNRTGGGMIRSYSREPR